MFDTSSMHPCTARRSWWSPLVEPALVEPALVEPAPTTVSQSAPPSTALPLGTGTHARLLLI